MVRDALLIVALALSTYATCRVRHMSGVPAAATAQTAAAIPKQFDLKQALPGSWAVTDQTTGKNGLVEFSQRGAYGVKQGDFNAGGTWRNCFGGDYQVLSGTMIRFVYSRCGPSRLARADPTVRIATVVSSGPDRLTLTVAGHTSVELLERVQPKR